MIDEVATCRHLDCLLRHLCIMVLELTSVLFYIDHAIMHINSPPISLWLHHVALAVPKEVELVDVPFVLDHLRFVFWLSVCRKIITAVLSISLQMAIIVRLLCALLGLVD